MIRSQRWQVTSWPLAKTPEALFLTLNPVPGRPTSGRPGTVFLGLALLIASAACDAPSVQSERRTLPLEEDTIQLDAGVARVDVVLRVVPSTTPGADTVRAQTGDVVRFIAGDAKVHAVVFDASRLDPQAHEFLERTSQLRGPPLVETGVSWVISLEDAPPGAYPFVDLSHDRHGVLLVTGETP